MARNKAIKASVSLYTKKERATKRALLDSGATESFIHPRLIKEAKLKRNPLTKPRKVKNIDGTLNKAGVVTHTTTFKVKY